MAACVNGHENPDGRAFCQVCGAALAAPPIEAALPVEDEAGASRPRRGWVLSLAVAAAVVVIGATVAGVLVARRDDGDTAAQGISEQGSLADAAQVCRDDATGRAVAVSAALEADAELDATATFEAFAASQGQTVEEMVGEMWDEAFVVEDDSVAIGLIGVPTDVEFDDPDAGKLSPIGAVQLVAFACLEETLGVPAWLREAMASTRALDGVQVEEFDDYSVRWSFHPDDGMTVVVREL